MKVTVTEIFCEVITGLAVTLLLIPFLALARILTLDNLYGSIVESLGLEAMTMGLVAAYVLGVLFDSVGLYADGFLEKRFGCQEPSASDKATFWKGVSAHVLAYRSSVWAYYFCYRNLLLLIPVAALGWLWILMAQGRLLGGIELVVLVGLFEWALWGAAGTLLTLYYSITVSFK